MSVVLSPFAGAGAQFFNDSGAPLAGGKLYSYAAGTTTPQVSYTTSTGVTPHTNPIILDAAGRVPSGGEIWLTDGLQYKFVVTTSIDTLIGTYDNILSSAADASSLNYTPPYTNSVTTTVTNKLAQTLTVQDFGAVGDGVTDDTVAIQNCLNAAPNGSRIRIPRGKYLVTSSLLTGNKTLIIEGDGYRTSVSAAFGNPNYANKTLYDGSIIFSTVTNGAAFDINPTSFFATHVKNLCVVGPGTGTSIGIRFKSATPGNGGTGLVWENVSILNFFTGFQINFVLNSFFNRVLVTGCTVGIDIVGTPTTGCNDNVWMKIETYFTGTHAVRCVDSAGNTFIQPLIQNMSAGGKGIYFGETVANAINDSLILNPWLEHGSGVYDSIYIDGGRNIHVLDAHGAGSARIVVNKGSKHRVEGTRLTGVGNVIEVGALATDTAIRDSDLESGGTILDNGVRTVIDWAPLTVTAAQIADSTSFINTTQKRAGITVWDTTNFRLMRSSGINSTDRWYEAGGSGYFVQPNTTGGLGNQTFSSGSGNPEAVVAAPEGSLRISTSSGAGRAYVKESGTGTTGWNALRPIEPNANAADIASATHPINTTGKFTGKFVWDGTNNRLMRASGTTTTSPWWVVDGSASVTPA